MKRAGRASPSGAAFALIAALAFLNACDPAKLLAPDPPQGLRVTNPTATSLTISWSESSGALGYELYRDTSATGGFSKKVYDGEGSSFTDTGLSPSATYWYRVLAKGLIGPSDLSAAASGRTLSGVPNAPTDFQAAIVSDTYVVLAWDAMPDATGYELYWDTSAGGAFSPPALYAGAATSFQHDGLTTETDYYYKLRATSSFGESSFTSVLHVMTGTVPATVTVQ